MRKQPTSPAGERHLRATSRWASLQHAVRGLQVLFGQPNARIQAAAAAAACGFGWGFNINATEWLAVIGAIAMVLGAEALNTAIECTVDLASPNLHPLARDAKDVAAAAVLLCSAASVLIGFVIFGPRIWVMLAA